MVLWEGAPAWEKRGPQKDAHETDRQRGGPEETVCAVLALPSCEGGHMFEAKCKGSVFSLSKGQNALFFTSLE